MSRVKSPQEKKRLAYDRDHVTPAEYPHAFRKLWPKKKATVERAARRKARRVLKASGDDTAATAVRRQQVRKWATVTVRQFLELKRQNRQQLAGRKVRRRGKAYPEPRSSLDRGQS
jgi:hypothetical protein